MFHPRISLCGSYIASISNSVVLILAVDPGVPSNSAHPSDHGNVLNRDTSTHLGLSSRPGILGVSGILGDPGRPLPINTRVSASTDLVPSSTDLAQIFTNHRKLLGGKEGSSEITISLLEWESSTQKNTKLALYAHDQWLHLVIVIFVDNQTPVIIEADPIGVSAIQWIPGPQPTVGSYSNDTQLAVFLPYGLESKIYSLLATTALISIPKPSMEKILWHPSNSDMWTMVSSMYFQKNLRLRKFQEASTVMSHFYNDGAVSRQVSCLELPFVANSSIHMEWSKSGKWLLVWNPLQLYGYDLYIYNLLCIHKDPVEDLAFHKAQATMTVTSSSLSLFYYLWGQIGHFEYVATVARGTENLELTVYNISNGVRTIKSLDIRGENIWALKDSFYLRASNSKLKLEEIRGITIVDEFILLNTGQYVVILAVTMKDLISVEISDIIAGEGFLKAEKFDDNLFIIFERLVIVKKLNHVDIIGTTESTISSVKFKNVEGEISIILVESSDLLTVFRYSNGNLILPMKHIFDGQVTDTFEHKRRRVR